VDSALGTYFAASQSIGKPQMSNFDQTSWLTSLYSFVHRGYQFQCLDQMLPLITSGVGK
jgi:hypothetical protein